MNKILFITERFFPQDKVAANTILIHCDTFGKNCYIYNAYFSIEYAETHSLNFLNYTELMCQMI